MLIASGTEILWRDYLKFIFFFQHRASVVLCLRPFVMRVFLRFKNGPFSQKTTKHNLMRLKTEQFHDRFFELQFDTAALIIQAVYYASFF